MSTSWWAIEESLVSPHNIEHLVFAGVSLRQCKLRFGPIITHFISTWRTVTRKIEPNLRWHRHSPLFHNNIFLSGKNPFYCPQWGKCKVNSFGEIYNDKGLKSFQDIKALFNLPGTSFFMYLCIRSAFRAYGVSWDAQLPVHSLRKVILPTDNSVISASVIYSFLLKQSYKPLSITTIWSKDISGDLQTLFSDQIWETITSSSKNPNHQMIHWKLLHRLYLSPLKPFYMHVSPSPNCNLCP